MLERTVCTFDVNVTYDECEKKFDNDEAPARSANGIKVISEVSENTIRGKR